MLLSVAMWLPRRSILLPVIPVTHQISKRDLDRLTFGVSVLTLPGVSESKCPRGKKKSFDIGPYVKTEQ